MQKPTGTAALHAVMMTTLLLGLAPAFGAEFRTSVRGESLVRSANYESGTAEMATAPYAAEPNLYASELTTGGTGFTDQPAYGMNGSCRTGPGWTYWGSLEFLLWWRKGQDLPPLVTSSATDIPAAEAGVLGASGTELLYPRETELGAARPGGRLSLGVWFDPCQFGGIGTRLFSLGESTSHYERDSTVVPVLARPFFNVDVGAEDAFQVAYPGSTTGSISVANSSRVSGGDVFYRRMIFENSRRRLDLIAGYQFARIDTDLTIASEQRFVAERGSQPQGTVLELSDTFDTRNSYHAGEIGLWGIYDRGPITWSLLAKVGLGSMNQRTAIFGQTVTTTPEAGTAVTNQGLLALETNSGTFKRNVFAVSPEVAVNAAYHLTDSIDLVLGYSFIHWNNVVQPESQIDRLVNPTQITGDLAGAARPAFPDSDTSYFVQGLNLGVQCEW